MRRSETWTPTWSTTGRSWTPPRGCCSRWELPSGSTRLIGAGAGCETTNYASALCFKNSWLPPQELLNRSALETQKLELLTEVSSLKLKLAAVDRDHRDGEVTLTPPPQAPLNPPLASPLPFPVLCDWFLAAAHSLFWSRGGSVSLRRRAAGTRRS